MIIGSIWLMALRCKYNEDMIKHARYTPYGEESKDLKEAKVGDVSTGWGLDYRKIK